MFGDRDLQSLSESDRRLLAAWLAAFEETWDEKRLLAQTYNLPPQGIPLRTVALRELVKIDLRHQWQRGKRVRLEAYLRSFPELGTPETASVSLIQAEIEARVRCGTPLDLQKVAQRFPQQFPELRKRLGQVPSMQVKTAMAAPAGSDPILEVIPVEPMRPAERRRAPRARTKEPVEQRGSIGPWLAAGGGCAAAVLIVMVVLVISLRHTGRTEPSAFVAIAPVAGSSTGRPVAPEDDGPPDPDLNNDTVARPLEGVPTIRILTESQMDAAGDAQTKADIAFPPEQLAFMRRKLSWRIGVGGKMRSVPPKIENLLRMLDMDGNESLIEDVGGDFGDKAVQLRAREVGLARHRDGRWVLALAAEGSTPYEMVKRERSQVVTLRGLQQTNGTQIVKERIYTLPPGAHDIQVTAKPNELLYRLRGPGGIGSGKPALKLEVKPHILSALNKLYGDVRFPKLWVARAAFRNSGAQAVTDYRVRFRLGGFSDWSGWNRTDVVYPGQTVVDPFRPVIDHVKVRELTGKTPADVLVEYEYVRADGQKVSETETVRTWLLGMNEGVFSDVKHTVDSAWVEDFKDAPLVLASFTSANDPVIQEVVGLLSKATEGGFTAGSDRDARRFLEALYTLMRCNISYETTPGVQIDGMLHQHLKYGRDVLRTKSGTCVNTSIFFASVAEAAGLHPSIIVVPGHAFAAVQLPESKEFVFVETTGCGGGRLDNSSDYPTVCRQAKETFQKHLSMGCFIQVDIAALREQGVTPPELPRVNPNIVTEWHITLSETASRPAAVAEAPPTTGSARATATILRTESIRKDGKNGLAVHVRLEIMNAQEKRCLIAAAFADENGEPVRSSDPAYSVGDEGYLIGSTAVTPDDENVEIKDLTIFVPYAAFPNVRGRHEHSVTILVLSDKGELLENPPMATFTITR